MDKLVLLLPVVLLLVFFVRSRAAIVAGRVYGALLALAILAFLFVEVATGWVGCAGGFAFGAACPLGNQPKTNFVWLLGLIGFYSAFAALVLTPLLLLLQFADLVGLLRRTR